MKHHRASARIRTLAVVGIAIATAVVGAQLANAQTTQPHAADGPAGATQAAPLPTFVGVVTKVDPLSISIRVVLPSPSAGGPTERTFGIDENTRVTIAQALARQRQGNFGQPNRVAARDIPATVNNLGVGQSVRIDSDHDVALDISVLAAGSRYAAGAAGTEPPARGKVLKIDATSITIGLDQPATMPSTVPAEQQQQQQQRTFRIDEKTRVLVPAAGVRPRVTGFGQQQQQQQLQQQRQQQPQAPPPVPYTNGALDEVKVGQTVLLREDGDLAIYIAVWPRR
jgi:hypothetical protein